MGSEGRSRTTVDVADGEVSVALDTLRRAGWDVREVRAHGFLTWDGRFVRTAPESMSGTHEPFTSRRLTEPYRPSDAASEPTP